jgi:hypothetical protein
MLFQVQLFAADTLGCLHGGTEPVRAGCPFHVAERQAFAGDGGADHGRNEALPASADLLDCAKCALQAGLHHAVAAPMMASAATPLPPENRPLPARHFFRFIPRQPKKPPILLVG